MTYAFHALGWFIYDRSPLMIMDDFGNAVIPNGGGWLASLENGAY